tara:strand:+ start:1546 stop:1881 length:336 start_codon:yes stop_codon:yes gene_type:complete
MENKNDTGGFSAPEASSATLDHKRSLAPHAQDLLQERTHGIPVWGRAPKKDVCPWTSFSRSKLYELASDGLIRSVSIRKPGQSKGTRLFHIQSILDYIAKCEAEAVKGGDK